MNITGVYCYTTNYESVVLCAHTDEGDFHLEIFYEEGLVIEYVLNIFVDTQLQLNMSSKSVVDVIIAVKEYLSKRDVV
jgi:hypothetical protein